MAKNTFVVWLKSQLNSKFAFAITCPSNIYLCFLASIYWLKVNKRNTKAKCEKCSKLSVKTRERHQRHSGVLIVNFEHIFYPIVSIVNFEHVIAGWDVHTELYRKSSLSILTDTTPYFC